MADVPDITAAVARTLQALRADRGWSLDQLAARSGVSKGVLVALEQGRSNPNLATLARIGDAFGVPVTLLVDVGGEPPVRIGSPDAARVLWRGPAGAAGSPVIGGGAVWVADYAAGTLYELDPATGATRYSLSLGTSLPHFASLSMTGNRAFLGTNEGVLAVSGA